MLDAADAGARQPQRAPSRRCAPSRARRCPACARRRPTLDAATPFVRQLRALVSKPELRGLVDDLRPTIPQLAKLPRQHDPVPRAGPGALELLQRGVIPWSNDTVDGGSGYRCRRRRPGLQGDRLRPRRDRRREPLRRRQRPVHPRRAAAAASTRSAPGDPDVAPDQVGDLSAVSRSRSSAPSRRIDASAKTAVQADAAVREPGAAEPRRRASAARRRARRRRRQRRRPAVRHATLDESEHCADATLGKAQRGVERRPARRRCGRDRVRRARRQLERVHRRAPGRAHRTR